MTSRSPTWDRWNPNAIHSVFQAAIDRANGVRGAATQIGDVMSTTPWEGDSHDAAMGATARIQADLIDHAQECQAVARAARAAEAEVRHSAGLEQRPAHGRSLGHRHQYRIR
jgi:hypothetical protein